MKKIFIILAVFFTIFTINADLIISEICDYYEDYNARYVEIYNPTDSTIDLTDYVLNVYINGNTSVGGTFDFTGSIAPGEAKVVTQDTTAFSNAFGKEADWKWSFSAGNGDDAFELVNNGTKIDVYGVIGEDGSGKSWEYTDRVATRVASVGTGNTTWTASEWSISPNDSSDSATPKIHTCDYPAGSSCNSSDTTPPDWAASGVSNINITDSSPSSVSLIWDQASDADQDTEPVTYDLYRSTTTPVDTSVSTLVVNGTLNNTYTDSTVLDNTQYYYKVVAKNCVPLEKEASDEVGVLTPANPNSPIYTIQYTTEQGSGCYDSPEKDKTKTISGIVTAVGTGKYVVAESSGAWHGIYVYDNSNTPSIGDNVTLTGTVSEYYGLTELGSVSSFTVNSTGNTVYPAITKTVEELGGDLPGAGCNPTDEQYEGVLVTFYNVEVSSATGAHGYWRIKDQGGTKELDCDDTFYHADMAEGQKLDKITGVLLYGYSRYRLNPRNESDIVKTCNSDTTPPDWATSGVSGISVTDPQNGSSLDISWNEATDNENSVEYDLYRSTATPVDTTTATLVASNLTGTNYTDTGLTKDQTYYYKVVAKNCVPLYKTATDEASGTPTLNVTFTSICDIQSFDPTDANSPAYSLKAGENVWVKGIATVKSGVFGTSGTSIYIQTQGGCGVNVFCYDTVNISEGDSVTVNGTVTEYRGVTEVKVSDSTTFSITSSGTTITPESIPTSIDINWENAEAKEGQLVTVKGTVVDTYAGSSFQKITVRDENDTRTGTNGLAIFWYNNTSDITYTASDFSIGDTVMVTGIMTQYDKNSPYTSGYEIIPRYQNDIQKVKSLEISGHLYSHENGWSTNTPVTSKISLLKNNSILELITSPNRIDTITPDNNGYFDFNKNIDSGATYIAFPEAVEDNLSPALAHYFKNVTNGYYPVFPNLQDSVNDVVVDMVDPVIVDTPDKATFNNTFTLTWEKYTGNALNDSWQYGNPTQVSYVIAIYDSTGEGTPLIYTGLGVDATSYTNVFFTPGEYKYYVFADAYNYAGSGETVPMAMTDYQYTFYITNGTPPAIENVEIVNNSTLNLTYSETVTTATAEDVNNYVVTPGDIKPIAATKTDATHVTLTFGSELTPGNYTLTITGVKDEDGNNIEWGNNNTAQFTITASKLAVKIYPNPANLNINKTITFIGLAGEGEISIYDTLGNIISRYHFNGQKGTIDISELASGIYFYIVKNDKETKVGKFAIVK